MSVNFQVNKAEAESFAKVWNINGVAIILPSESIQFATDFANVVLNNFVAMCQERAAQEAAKRANVKPLIVEGV